MKFLILVGALLQVSVAFANPNDGAYLDPPYAELNHPWVTDLNLGSGGWMHTLNKSNASWMMDQLSSVKAQGSRGTCSIFAATAALESLLILNKGLPKTTDLSEEWLEYLVMRSSGAEGSSSYSNFRYLVKYGSPDESAMPYIGETWESVEDSPLAQDRCGHAPQGYLKHCLLGHRDPRLLSATQQDLLKSSSELHDPEFAQARQQAGVLKEKYLTGVPLSGYSVKTTGQVKALLDAGVPVTLDINFFYGAWNHREADTLGIGRDMDHWDLGIVGYPEPGSVDRGASYKEPAGHAVLVVGYDNGVKVTTRVQMQDGSTREFTYKGVYYIKNSWGTDGFGQNFTLNGKKYPGYGMITQKYAHEFGGFNQLPLE